MRTTLIPDSDTNDGYVGNRKVRDKKTLKRNPRYGCFYLKIVGNDENTLLESTN